MVEFPKIETKRLLLRELTLLDAKLVLRHFSDSEVTRYMDIEVCQDIREAEEIIQFHIDDAGCRYGIFDRTNNELVGTCGFHCWEKGQNSRAEIGFDLSSRYWGQGLMQEALEEVIRMGFDIMDLTYIEATVENENIRSRRLLNKMNFIKQVELKDNLDYYILMKQA
ncbi:GNAT family N-acetyltransferase [Paenibacillus durus]|uniref:GCN5 family acetyltransferase n=1 Tax=Paenibacillus durus TaxID=44251 RepID=A0A089HW98_PAEDU|nr:GNAT family N-acetyltransferase [Paenibacillus durus]AIQ15020.1 GCN5 family acetyltransferase [Paenibacillus durus]